MQKHLLFVHQEKMFLNRLHLFVKAYDCANFFKIIIILEYKILWFSEESVYSSMAKFDLTSS